jgi:large subunit ribosomal protein L3
MPGHMGDVRRTISGLEVVRIDTERQLLLVKGSVPGSNGGDVVVQPAAKFYKPVVKQAPKPQAKAEPRAAKPAAKPEAKPAAKQPAPAKS